MLPCKINVYEKNGIVSLSALRPTVIKNVFPDIDITGLITEVDEKMKEIVDKAK